MLQIIFLSAETLLNLINDILDISQLDAQNLHLRKEGFNIRETVEDLSMSLAPKASANGVDLTTRLIPGCPSTVYGDRQRFQQVVNNLIS